VTSPLLKVTPIANITARWNLTKASKFTALERNVEHVFTAANQLLKVTFIAKYIRLYPMLAIRNTGRLFEMLDFALIAEPNRSVTDLLGYALNASTLKAQN
jgi:hypothetical protein